MNEVIIQQEEKIQEVAPDISAFKGYSLEELRYQRALIAIRKEYSKAHMLRGIDSIRRRRFFGKSPNVSKMAHFSGIATKVFNGLGYVDYALMGVSAFTAVRKVLKFFHRKK